MAIALMSVGLAVLIGWGLDIPLLKSVAPGFVTMKANTALAFFFSGLSLLLLRRKEKNRFCLFGRIVGSLVLLIGALSLSQYLFSLDLGIDEFLFHDDPDPLYTVHPGRMAAATAFAFAMGGSALLLMDLKIGKWISLSQLLALWVGFVGLVSLLGYLYGKDPFYFEKIVSYTRVALHTSLAFLAFCAGLFFSRPYEGLMQPVTADDGGGLMARRLLPFAMTAPVILGCIRWWAFSSGHFDLALETAFLVTLNMGALVIAIWFGALVLHHIEMRQRELETAKEEFLHIASHELRVPLAAIKMALENLETGTGGPLTERQSRTVEIVEHNIDRLIRLLNNLLGLSRLESGAVKMNLKSLCPKEAVSEVVSTFRFGLGEGKIHLKKEIEGKRLIRADSDFFSEVLVNLLSNAVRHARSCVIIKEEEGKEIGKGRKGVEFSVIDDGPGIPPGDMKLLFGRFVQIDQPGCENRPVYRGTGLGLAICKKIVEQMGGKIWAESQVGEGTKFHFVLPEA